MIKIRSHNENDKVFLEQWVAADPEHSKTTPVSFWLPPKDKHKGSDYIVVEDATGVIGYLVLENCLRIHCQFPPSTETERIRAAMPEFLARLKSEAKLSYRQLIFESVSGGLIWAARKIGFRRSKNEVVCNL